MSYSRRYRWRHQQERCLRTVQLRQRRWARPAPRSRPNPELVQICHVRYLLHWAGAAAAGCTFSPRELPAVLSLHSVSMLESIQVRPCRGPVARYVMLSRELRSFCRFCYNCSHRFHGRARRYRWHTHAPSRAVPYLPHRCRYHVLHDFRSLAGVTMLRRVLWRDAVLGATNVV